MLLSYFTEEAYDRLLHEIDVNATKYTSGEEWLADYFGSSDNWYRTSKTVDVADFNPYYVPGQKDDAAKTEEDLVNTRLLYNAMKGLTPLQASNQFMWTYLCHAVPKYRRYIIDRWLSSERDNTIKTRFFVTGSSSLLNDNALSRLWWYGYLTYDSSAPDHFALTKILLTNQTICTDVMDTLNRMNPVRMKGVLWAIRDFKESIGEGEGITDYFRECKKYLNHYAAVTNLDFLEPEDIQDLAYNYMMTLRKQVLNGGSNRRNALRNRTK